MSSVPTFLPTEFTTITKRLFYMTLSGPFSTNRSMKTLPTQAVPTPCHCQPCSTPSVLASSGDRPSVGLFTSSISKSSLSSVALWHSSQRDHHSGHRWEKPLSHSRETHFLFGCTAIRPSSGVHSANLSLADLFLPDSASGLLTEVINGSK